jgi:PAS domain S-box-containing protein
VVAPVFPGDGLYFGTLDMKQKGSLSASARDSKLREDTYAGGGADISPMSPDEISSLVKDLQVHSHELEAQNDELRTTQLLLSEARDRFSELFDKAPVGYLTLAPDRRIKRSNLTAAELLGVERNRLIGVQFESLLAHEDCDACYRLFRDAESATACSRADMRLARNDEDVRWVQIDAVWSQSKGREVGEWCVTLQNVTGRKIVEHALRESEERLRGAVDAADVGTWRVDLRSGLDRRDARLNRILGLEARESTQPVQDFFGRIHPEDQPRAKQAWLAAVGGTDLYDEDVRIVLPDSEVRWIRDRGVIVRGSDGEPLYATGAVVDVTERKRAEETRAYLAAIVESTQDAIISKTLEGRITSWNTGAERTFGYSGAEAVGQSINLIIPSELWEEERAILERLRRGERIESFETVRVTRVGRRIDISLTISPIRDVAGRIVGASHVSRDISERKRAEQALRESEERFRQIADAAPVMIWISGPDKLCNWFNKPWLVFTGRSLDEELGSGWADNVHSDDYQRCLDTYCTSFDKRDAFSMEYRLRRHDGEFRWVLDYGTPHFDPGGGFAGYIGSCIDITDRKRHEEQLRTAMAELNHRVKNTLATVDAVAQQTLRQTNDLPGFRDAFSARLRSMAAAHSLLTRTEWRGTELHDILTAELAARVSTPEHLMLDGPRILIKPKAALALHMAIHELTTNASKYGSLSTPDGRVHIGWEVTGGDEVEELQLVWKERHGPPVTEPRATSFGSRLIREVVSYELNGSAELCFQPDGLCCRVAFPLTGVGCVLDGPRRSAVRAGTRGGGPGAPGPAQRAMAFPNEPVSAAEKLT